MWERIERGNLLLRSHLQAWSDRRREALRQPQREEGGILWRPPARLQLVLHGSEWEMTLMVNDSSVKVAY